MWTCVKCGEEVDDNFDICWNCFHDKDKPLSSKDKIEWDEIIIEKENYLSQKKKQERSGLYKLLTVIIVIIIVVLASFSYGSYDVDNVVFKNGFTSIKNIDGMSLINKKGKLIFKIPGRFAPNRLTAALKYNFVGSKTKYCYLNDKYEMIIKPKFDNAKDFEEGSNLAAVKLDSLWGFINKKGEIIIKPQFENVYSFEKGVEVTAIKIDSKWGFMNKNGEIILKPKFDEIRVFKEKGIDIVAIQIDSKWGFVNKNGKIVIQPQFKRLSNFNRAGIIITEIAGTFFEHERKFGIVNKEGTIVLKPKYDRIGQFKENGNIEVKLNGKWFCVNKSGKKVKENVSFLSQLIGENYEGKEYLIDGSILIYYYKFKKNRKVYFRQSIFKNNVYISSFDFTGSYRIDGETLIMNFGGNNVYGRVEKGKDGNLRVFNHRILLEKR